MSPISRRLWLAPIGALAFGLRLWGINFGLPAIYRPDEDVVVGRAMGILHGTLNPQFANWPHLYMYVSAAWLAIFKPLFPLFGPAAPYLGVRLLDAALGTATVLLLYSLGRRAYGQLTGLLAALFLAVAFLPVRDAHFATIDTPLAFTCVTGLMVALHLGEADRRRYKLAGGVLVGLAAGVKYNGSLLLASLAAAQAINRSPRSRALLGMVAIGVLAIITFLLTSPFLLIDVKAFLAGIGYIFHHLSSASQPEIGYLHIPRLALWYGLDPPLFVLSVFGIGYALLRQTRADWIVLAFLLAYYALLGSGFSVFVRYADPLVPPLLMLGARGLADVAARMTRPAVAAAFSLVILVGPAFVHDLTFEHLIQQEDTRTQAFDWLSVHVPIGSRVATLYFAGVAHDQAMIDRGDQSHGAGNAYVASFLQNRLEDRYSVHELAEAELQRDTLSTLLADGVQYVVYSATTPGDGCGPGLPLGKALLRGALLRATFSPTDSHCTEAVFDPIDGYYVPLSGYQGWSRPGPSIQIFALQPRQ